MRRCGGILCLKAPGILLYLRPSYSIQFRCEILWVRIRVRAFKHKGAIKFRKKERWSGRKVIDFQTLKGLESVWNFHRDKSH